MAQDACVAKEKKNEISIDDYLLNNTPLVFFSLVRARVLVCVRCRRRERMRLSNFSVSSRRRRRRRPPFSLPCLLLR